MADIYFPTYTGRHFTPLEPRAEDVDALDIAHSLSMQCRFNGHLRLFYSVAEHSVLMSYQVSEAAAFLALMHDGQEAYLSDIISPLKIIFNNVAVVEKKIWQAVQVRFGIFLTPDIVSEVEFADLRMCATEKIQLINDDSVWASLRGIEPYDITIEGWGPVRARTEFLSRCRALRGQV